MKWYIPSFYGDVKLESDDDRTTVSWENLTATEGNALVLLCQHAVAKNWLGRDFVPDELRSMGKAPFRVKSGSKGELRFMAPLAKVRKKLVAHMKPKRQTLDFVKFSDGRIVEGSSIEKGFLDEVAADPKAAGATVPKPDYGCPEPRLARAELRATNVLFAFLDRTQQIDFLKRQQFVTRGASGTRYMVTSRHNREALKQYRRQLYNLDTGRVHCVHHDLSVPVAEEMLTLHLVVQVPRFEREVLAH